MTNKNDKKTQAEIWDKRLKYTNVYRILMVFFLITTVVGTTLAIIFNTNFKNYKNSLEHTDWISVVIQTKKMPGSVDPAVYSDYQLNVNNYGGAKIDGDWKGKTLDDFLRSKPGVFTFDKSGLVIGILGSESKFSPTTYWWALYSPTDPASAAHPDELSQGAPSMILQNANVYYFALQELKPI